MLNAAIYLGVLSFHIHSDGSAVRINMLNLDNTEAKSIEKIVERGDCPVVDMFVIDVVESNILDGIKQILNFDYEAPIIF